MIKFEEFKKEYLLGHIDGLLIDVAKEVSGWGKVSATDIRRKYGIGYPRAARIIDQMELFGFISQPNGIASREVFVDLEDLFKIAELEKNKETERAKQVLSEEYDPLMKDALYEIIKTQSASVTLLQRRFEISYPRASRIIDILVENGYITEPNGRKGREINITMEQLDELFEDK